MASHHAPAGWAALTTTAVRAVRSAQAPVAHVAAVLSAAAVALAVVLTLSTPPGNRALEPGPTPAVGLLAAAVGAVIVAQRPRNLVAWLLIASGVTSAAYSLAAAATALGLVAGPQASWLPWTAWISTAGWVPGTVLGLVLLPQLFPSGTLLPGRFWRAWWWGSAGVAATVFITLALTPASPLFPQLPNPWLAGQGSEGTQLGAAVQLLAVPWGQALTVLFAVMSAGSAVNIVLRFKRSAAAERRKTSLVFGAWLLLIVASSVAVPWLGAAAAVLYLAALLWSVARYRLYEIDRLISRGTAGLLCLVVLGAAYVLTVWGLGLLLHNQEDSWAAGFAATAVVVILLDPVRRLALRWVNRIFSRGRPGPSALGSTISTIAAQASTPRAALEQSVAMLRGALHMPGLEVLAGPEDSASGMPDGIPLRWNGTAIGALVVAPRRGRTRVSSADSNLLTALEPTLALLVHDLVLTRDLEASRGDLLGAREEERRRIRRDLHDGLGPLLAGTAMTLQAAAGNARPAASGGNAVAHPFVALDLLAQARTDLAQAVSDIRVLVDGLRPPILDDRGLVAAIEAALPESALAVTVATTGNCRNLPAAVEVAALRIAAEALTNVAKHAGATAATVELHASETWLSVTVVDNGTWMPPSSARSGVGLGSMRQRAQELGGHTRITANGGPGTRVRAWLPLTPPSQADAPMGEEA